MEFDQIIKRTFYNEEITYGIIEGNSTIVLIKPGQDGTLNGFKNKYLTLATNINKEYGYTVICSNNPYDKKHNPIIDAIDLIEELNIKDYEIYYIGNSIGGMLGARYGYQFDKIKKMLLINPPLFKNVDLILSGLRKFDKEKVALIYVSMDPSMINIKFLDLINNDKVKYYILENEEHNISIDKFLELPNIYILDKK